jgi:signal transduction histidine kinase
MGIGPTRESDPHRRRLSKPPVSSGGLLVVREVHPLIKKAALEVERGWAMALGDQFDKDETDTLLEWLSEAVDLASRGISPDRGHGASAMGRFLLDRLGTVLHGLVSSDPSIERGEALRLIGGVDAVRRAIEPEWDRYFSSQMAGPDGLNLVVEVAHDIRSPLTSIRCLAETLERGQSGAVTETQRHQLRLIYSAALGLSSLATDVIEIARRGDQLVDGSPVPFSLNEMMESVIDLVRPIAEEKGLSITFTAVPGDQRRGMPIALSRVLINLMTNALKFTEAGTVELHARVSGPGKVEFAVKDTGRGISEEALATLYQPFRRASGRTGRSGYFFSGTGLGLAMVRKLLSSMNSELRFETEAGKGTRFFFELDLPQVGTL